MAYYDSEDDIPFEEIYLPSVKKKVNIKLADSTTHYIRGTAYWAKVTGKARKNNFDDYYEWTIDVSPDAEGLKLVKQLGMSDRQKDPKSGDPRGDNRYITFRQKAHRADGTPNEPIKIVEADGKTTWDDNKLIGNGSKVDIKFRVKDYGKGKKAGVYIVAIRVLDLVKFESQAFAPLDEDDEFFAAEDAKVDDKTFKEDFGLADDDLDDDVPGLGE